MRWPGMRTGGGALTFAVALVLQAGCSEPPPDAPQRWRVGMAAGYDLLLVTLDTTRADHLGCYGDPEAETPNLDRLAHEGVRFTDALTVAPLTLPAHATLLTGLLPPHHGVRRNGSELRLGREGSTLGEVLDRAGYASAAFVSAFVLDARYGIGRGFTTYDDRVEAVVGPSFAAGTLERKAPRTTDAYLRWLERQKKGDKLFAWIHYYDAHAPYEPPPDLARRFAGRLYDGEIALVDRELGRVIAALERSGRIDRTLIVVVGDHGESLGEHGELSHGHFIYDSTMRVPLIVHAPTVLGQGVVDGRVVSIADLLSTVVDLLGVDDPEPRDGESWVGRPIDGERAVYLETLAPYFDYGWAPLVGLRTLRDKAILAPRRELYDLADDPREERNLYLSGSDPALSRSRDLFARLEKESVGRPSAGAPQESISDEERAQLQALGYLGGAGPAPVGESLADPKDRVAVYNALIQANFATTAGRLDEAEKWLRQASAASPRDRSVLFALGKLRLLQGRLAEAEDFLHALSAIQPRADLFVLLAQIAIADGREEEARLRLAEAERLEPRHGGIFIARGDLLLRRGEVTAAEASYREAIRLDPYRSAGMARARLEALTGARKDS